MQSVTYPLAVPCCSAPAVVRESMLPRICMPATGKLELQRRLKGLPVLIVLDDVGDGDASKLLSIPALASGSLVIITSRSRAALSRAGCHHVHSVQLLSPTAAAALFMANAAQDGSLSAAVQQRTVTAVVRMCQGLPLSLKVHRERLV